MKKMVLFVVCFTFLTGCNVTKESSYTSELCSFGPMMVLNGKQYIQVNESKALTVTDKLGEISYKMNEELHPTADFTSNTLEEGTTIYSVKGYDHYVVAKTLDNKYLLFDEIK